MLESRSSSTTLRRIPSIFVSSFLFDTATVLMWWQNVKVNKNRGKASVLSVCTLVYTGFFVQSHTCFKNRRRHSRTQYSVLAEVL